MAAFTRQDIVDTARKALGTPWVHQGRVVPAGVDCAGLILWVLRQHGISNFEPPPYSRNAKWDEFLGFFQRELVEIPISEAREGSVLVFRQFVFPCHCGIITQLGDDPKFIHSYMTRGRVVEERYLKPWPGVTRAAFDYPGVV